MVSKSKQEEEMKQYLLKSQIAFEQHKRITGCGGKTWIVDFYLPDHSIVVEMKMINYLKARRGSETNLGGIYKDLYKLDELIHKYNLTGVIMLECKNYQIPKGFIRNVNAHNIFYIWEPQQIMPILQLKSTEASNKIPRTEFIEIAQPTPPEPPSTPKVKKEKPVIFSDKDTQILWEWSHGKTAKALGLDRMTIHRLSTKYIRKKLLTINEPKETLDGYAKL